MPSQAVHSPCLMLPSFFHTCGKPVEKTEGDPPEMQDGGGSVANRGNIIEPGRGLMNLWDRILTSLQTKMNSQTFNTWMRPTQQLSLAEGRLHVEVPSVHFADWINRNYMQMIHESAR